jgi:hypothetical protein
MIPRVRLLYVLGLATAHDDLRRPREVDLTTDGESLIVASPASGRPLAKLPLTAVDGLEVEAVARYLTPESQLATGLTGTSNALVLRFRAAPGVAAALAGQPMVFADPRHRDVTTQLGAVKHVLLPRTALEMSRLERGERRHARNYTIAFLALAAIALVFVVLVLITALAPRPRDASASFGVVFGAVAGTQLCCDRIAPR